MRKFLLYAATACLPLTCFSIPASAADFFVKGVVADSLTNETEPYATLRVDRADGSTDKAIALFVSDEKGAFSEQLPASGEYKLTVSGARPVRIFSEFCRALTIPVNSENAKRSTQRNTANRFNTFAFFMFSHPFRLCTSPKAPQAPCR